MKLIAATAVIAVLTSMAPVAYATNTDVCCACLEVGDAQAAGFINGTATAALFCAAANSVDVGGLGDRCDSLAPEANLVCEPNIPGPSCAVQLAGGGIICPAAGVPAAGPLNLAALVVVLAAAGAFLLRRRRGVRGEAGARP